MEKNSRVIKLTVWKNQKRYEINANLGQNLRKTLIDNGLSPYSIINEKINISLKNYYFSNVISRASKTMIDCHNSKLDIKKTGTEG